MVAESRNWKIKELISAGFLEVGDGYRAKNNELGDSGLPFARAGNINGGFNFADADRFPIANLSRVGNKVSQFSDVVFTSKGTVGRFAFVDATTERFVYSPQLCYWRSLSHAAIDPRFLYYWMQSSECLDQFSYLKSQTDMADYVSLRDQREMTILLPDTSLQTAIVSLLAPLDSRLDILQRTNELLEAIARAIFKSWFVDFDPVKAKAEGREPNGMDVDTVALFPSEFQDSPLGQVPSGWEVAPLYGIAEFSNGAAYKDIHFSSNNEGLPVIKIAELKAGVTESTKFTTTYLAERFRIEQEEILFSWSGNPDTSIDTFIWDGGPAWLNQHIFRVRDNGYAPRSWVYIQLKTLRSVFAETARDKQTTGLGHVTVADMKRLLVCKPTDEIVLRFDEIAKPILARIAANQLAIRKLAALRDTLLPRLISGKLRVPEAEAMLTAV